MRLSFFLLLFSFSAFAQLDVGNGSDGACTQATFGLNNGGTFNCTTLNITGALPAFAAAASPLIFKVQGSVTISFAINLNGANGITNLALSTSSGGDGGPGAGNGGGDDGSGTPLGGSDGPPNSGFAASAGNLTCGDGGGGAGFSIAGSIGDSCTGGIATPGAGGSVFDIETLFRGGFGGGAGGDSSDGEYGGGGGGGGAIHIAAGGDVSIASSITANGGDGGNGGAATPDGGGGGGGSGGVIWIQSLGQINMTGSLDALAGTGGDGNTAADGIGGDGGLGFVLLEDIDGSVLGAGVPGYAQIGPVIPLGSSSSLKSDISCGTMKPVGDEDHSQIFQMIMAFLLVIGISKFFSKTHV